MTKIVSSTSCNITIILSLDPVANHYDATSDALEKLSHNTQNLT